MIYLLDVETTVSLKLNRLTKFYPSSELYRRFLINNSHENVVYFTSHSRFAINRGDYYDLYSKLTFDQK